MNTGSRAQFIDFDDFAIGDMVKECRCGGIMSKQRVRLFSDVPAVIDIGLCERCGDAWDGRID